MRIELTQDFQRCIYQSPSGEKFEFDYSGSLEESFDHRTSDFVFVGHDGSYIQDNGITAREFPLELHLFNKRPLEIDRIRFALAERGIGILQHPDKSVGTIYVVVRSVKKSVDPIGDTLKTRFSINFVETIPDLQNSRSRPSDIASVDAQIANFSAAISTNFIAELIEDISEAYSAAVDAIRFVNALIRDTLLTISQIENEINTKFLAIYGEISSLADTLVTMPAQLVAQFKTMISLPGFVVASSKQKLKEYKRLWEGVLGINDDGVSTIASFEPTDANKNQLLIYEVVVATVIGVEAQIAVATDYDNRGQALDAADKLAAEYQLIVDAFAAAQSQYAGTIFMQKYISRIADLAPAISAAIRGIRARAASLAVENYETLAQDEHPIVTAARLYGNVRTETLEKFYRDNEIVGIELFGMRAGREIVWYS